MEISTDEEYDTVEGHVAAGTVVPRKSTTADDLLMAATWCENCEGPASDDNVRALAAAAGWLRRQAELRAR